MGQFQSADEYTFYQADRFYRRGDADPYKRIPDHTGAAPSPEPPQYDFHRIVASLANYPELLRRLGLVVDLAIEDGQLIDDRILAGGGEGKGLSRLVVKWDGDPPGKESLPATAWIAHKERFVPRPRSAEHRAGLLRLEHSDDGWRQVRKEQEGIFDLYQVDPDGAALKTVNFTLTAQNLVARSLDPSRRHGAVTYTTGDRQAGGTLLFLGAQCLASSDLDQSCVGAIWRLAGAAGNALVQ